MAAWSDQPNPQADRVFCERDRGTDCYSSNRSYPKFTIDPNQPTAVRLIYSWRGEMGNARAVVRQGCEFPTELDNSEADL